VLFQGYSESGSFKSEPSWVKINARNIALTRNSVKPAISGDVAELKIKKLFSNPVAKMETQVLCLPAAQPVYLKRHSSEKYTAGVEA
jgi:hypothetical protein